jgi:hypothetical protein
MWPVCLLSPEQSGRRGQLGAQISTPRRASAAAELPLRALRAVEDDLCRFVVGQVRGPPFLVRRQPKGLALGAMNDEGYLLGAPRESLGRLLHDQDRRLVGIVVSRPDDAQRPAAEVDRVSGPPVGDRGL